MASKNLDGIRVAILLDTDFEQVEMTEPRKALEDAGGAAATFSICANIGREILPVSYKFVSPSTASFECGSSNTAFS